MSEGFKFVPGNNKTAAVTAEQKTETYQNAAQIIRQMGTDAEYVEEYLPPHGPKTEALRTKADPVLVGWVFSRSAYDSDRALEFLPSVIDSVGSERVYYS